jgi:hypothetical protein
MRKYPKAAVLPLFFVLSAAAPPDPARWKSEASRVAITRDDWGIAHIHGLSDADAVFGSRMLGGRPIEGGMPKWKYFANLFLTMVENATFYVYLSEYHSGFRAYSKRFLETVNYEANSDNFVFDTQIIAQAVAKGLRIREVPIRTRYFDEASQVGFWRGVRYGMAILKTMVFYKLHKKKIWSHPIFRDRIGEASRPSAVGA